MTNILKSVFFTALLFSCQQPSNTTSKENTLGQISISVNGSQEAIPHFEKGMLLLHSFEYSDATEAFQKAQEVDSTFAMAYWGEAMCKNHPLWREQEYTEAKEIIEKLGPHKEAQLSKFKSEFEKDMFHTLTVLFGPGTKKERDLRYAEEMEKLTKKYPDNHEVHAFYALSLIGASKGGRDQDLYSKGAKIAEGILKENPNHPGALHYKIHGYDHPEYAHLALDAANSYAKVAPDAAHALHMPSHIYVALGMWDEVISSNIASWEASKSKKEAKNLSNNKLNYHAFKWWMYGHLQKQEFSKSKKLVLEMKKYCEEEPSSKAMAHLVMMRGAHCVEANDWDDALFEDDLDYSDLAVQVMGAHQFVNVLRAFKKNDGGKMEKHMEQLADYITLKSKKMAEEDTQMCGSSYDRSRPTPLHIDRAMVMLNQCKALKYKLEGNDKLAMATLKEAVELEESTSYMYGPPEIIKPSKELLAEWLLETGHIDQALKLFEGVLERAPKRRIAVEGIQKIDTKK